MPKSLTKEQRRELTFSSQANTEEDLMEVFRREHMFDGAVSQNLSEGGYAMSEEEKRKVDSHLKDRKQLQDEKKRVRDKSAENIAKTDERVQALGHMDTAKKQLKNYMDKYVESAEFDELVKSKLKDANPNLAKLIDWGDRLNEMLDDLLQTPGMTEKTKVAIYNKIQGTRQYVNGCTKELARCIYMKNIFTKKLGENIKDENLINELINMDEISKYQKDIENFVGNSEEKKEEKEFEIGKEGEEKESQLNDFEKDIKEIAAEIEKAKEEAKQEDAPEEVKEEIAYNIKESKKTNKKLFTMKEAIEYQRKKVEEEINYYKDIITNLQANKKRLAKLEKGGDEADHMREMDMKNAEVIVCKKSLHLIKEAMKQKNYSEEELMNKIEFVEKQIDKTGANYIIPYMKSFYEENAQLFTDQRYQEKKNEIDKAIEDYNKAFKVYDDIVRERSSLNKKVKDAEKYGSHPPIHPLMKEYEIRQRAEKMLLRQYRPDTLRQVDDKVKQVKEGKIYDLRMCLSNDYREDIRYNLMEYYHVYDKKAEKQLSLNEIENISVEFLKMLIDKSKFCMCVPGNVDKILTNTTGDGSESDQKFKNSVEVGNKSQTYNENRKAFTEAKYGTEFTSNFSDYEKYGYMDDESGIFKDTSYAKNFGEVKYVLKKNRLKHRTTFVLGDSYVEQSSCQPSLLTKPSLTSIPFLARTRFIKLAMDYHNASDEERQKWEEEGKLTLESILRMQEKPQKGLFEKSHLDYPYYELQFHGDLNVDDVEEVNYYLTENYDMPKNMVDYLKEKKDTIKAWKAKGVKVNLIMVHQNSKDKGMVKKFQRSMYNLSREDVDVDALIKQGEEISEEIRKSGSRRFIINKRTNERMADVMIGYATRHGKPDYNV